MKSTNLANEEFKAKAKPQLLQTAESENEDKVTFVQYGHKRLPVAMSAKDDLLNDIVQA